MYEGGAATVELASGIYRADSRNEVMYALDCGGAHALVDVGSEAGLEEKLGQLEADGVDLDTIAALFITHCHPDHAGAVARLREQKSPRVVAHRLAVEQLGYCSAYTPIDGSMVDYTVDEGDTVEIGELSFQVHHMPGHSPDTAAWRLGDSLFVGDLIRCDGTIGGLDVDWGSCVGDYRSSLQRLLRLPIKYVYPGHGECGKLTRESVEEGLRRLDALVQADDGQLTATGRPAPRRGPDVPTKIVRLPTVLPGT
jgi:glyoxylase-like metal-dependent hydrolase (beta-lactamase superfamily II)